MDESSISRFWSKVERRGASECWLWRGCLNKGGYGRFDSRRTAHRISWEIHFGEITGGASVCHSCDVRNCVNPSHLWLGTYADNMADMDAKGRRSRGVISGIALRSQLDPATTRGSRNARSKLREEDVQKIRVLAASGVTQVTLAGMYGVSHIAIGLCVRRQTWKHVA